MEKEIRKAPEWFYLELIDACAAVENYKGAIGYCNRLLDTQPVDIDLLYTKAMLQYKDHDFGETLKTLKVLRDNDFEKLYEKDAKVLYYYAFTGMRLKE
jgi:hypothetical protein